MPVLKAPRALVMVRGGSDAALRAQGWLGQGWWGSTDPHHCFSPQKRLLFAFFPLLFKSLSKFQAGKVGSAAGASSEVQGNRARPEGCAAPPEQSQQSPLSEKSLLHKEPGTKRPHPEVQGGTPGWVMRAVTFHERRARPDLPFALMQPLDFFPISLQSGRALAASL